jgi:protein CpxP
MMSRLPPTGLAALAALTVAFSAHAQTAHAQAPREQTPDLSSLHDALHLTAAQEDGWRAYRAAITPDPSADARRRSAAMMMSTLTTPRRIDLINAEMEEDFAAMRHQGQAVKAFYATLTPDQQRTFDRQTMPSGGNGGQTLRQPSQSQRLPAPH